MKRDCYTTWLRAFRRSVARPDRQALIDETDLGRALDEVEAKSPAARAIAYPGLLYVAAAQGLEHPATASTPELGARRQQLLVRMVGLFGLPLAVVAEDLRGMMRQLEADHATWRRRHDREQKRAGRAASLAPADSPTPDLEARR